MDYTRKELLPGVFLTHLRSDKFKTACMSVNLLTQLQRETAAMTALIPQVLRRGTARYGDMEQLSCRLDELYGTAIEPTIRRIGEIHCPGFFASFPEGEYLPGGEKLLNEVAVLMAEMLLAPATRGGLLLQDYVESEKDKLLDLIRSRVNEKRSYALSRCIEEMCCFEDFAVSRFGSEDEAENIHYKKLTKHYRQLLQCSPVELFYCGKAGYKQVSSVLKDAFSSMPRGEIDYDIGTDVRMNAVEDRIRYVEEEMDVSQGKLVMGFRLGECMDEPDIPAIYVFNAIFGSGANSKLFMNVREKLSLCYFASSMLEKFKGLMLVSSGIEFEKYQQARDEILAQLEACRRGEITGEELEGARRIVMTALHTTLDSQSRLADFWLGQAVAGLEEGPDQLARRIECVTVEQVAQAARKLQLDTIYFLNGKEGAQ